MNVLLLAVGFGLVTASTIAIAAVGLAVQFGVTNYVNFAFGDFMALGAYLSWEVNTQLRWNIWISLIFGSIAMGIIAVLLDRFVLGPFARRFKKAFYVLIVTFGLSLILLNMTSAVWGTTVNTYAIAGDSPLHLGPFLLTVQQLIVIGVAVVLMVAIHLMLTRTRIGKSMRAMSDNTTLAMTSGINTRRVTAITWFISGTLAGLGGTILGITEASLTPGAGETYLFVIFAAVIMGGIGSIYGAMIGALIIGLATEISAVYINPSYKLDIAFIFLILTLLIRPSGIFSRVGKS